MSSGQEGFVFDLRLVAALSLDRALHLLYDLYSPGLGPRLYEELYEYLRGLALMEVEVASRELTKYVGTPEFGRRIEEFSRDLTAKLVRAGEEYLRAYRERYMGDLKVVLKGIGRAMVSDILESGKPYIAELSHGEYAELTRTLDDVVDREVEGRIGDFKDLVTGDISALIRWGGLDKPLLRRLYLTFMVYVRGIRRRQLIIRSVILMAVTAVLVGVLILLAMHILMI